MFSRILLCVCLLPSLSFAQSKDIELRIDAIAKRIENQVIEWRRDIHQHPELGNREFRTAEKVAAHLRSLGMEVQTGVAHTGVVGILRGSRPGPVVALRADMDALPISEATDLPFASKVKMDYDGKSVGVMHACGHDAHVAILMGAASLLTELKEELPGTVKFIFQPAEEGPPPGEEGGAALMIKQGVMENPKVEAIFGLHSDALIDVGKITYRPGGTMASACDFKVTIRGKPAHGGSPWSGVDPIVTAAQVVTALQTIVSRNLNVTENAGVISIGSIQGGNRFNIIPEEVVMTGTVRALSKEDEKMMFDNIKRIAEHVAAAAGATAEVEVPYSVHFPVTTNDRTLTREMLPSLERVAGDQNVLLVPQRTVAEDFSFYAEQVPGLFFFLGGKPKGVDPSKAAPHHTASFYLDESGFIVGVRAFAQLVFDYAAIRERESK